MTLDDKKTRRVPIHPGTILLVGAALAVPMLWWSTQTGSAQETEVTTEVAPKSDAQQAASPLRTEITRFEAWSVTCQYGQDGSSATCSASLRVNQQGTGRGLLNWSIGRAADGKLVQSVQTLSGVQIAPGVQLKAGPKGEVTLPYVSCAGAECAAAGPLEAEFLRKAVQAKSMAVVVRAVDGKDYTFTFSANGLRQAAAAVQGK